MATKAGPDTAPTLHLGCGTDHRPDAVNVDEASAVDPDAVVDLEATPWPFADGAFDTVVARHVLEHLEPVPWAEIVRVLRAGGHVVWTYPIGHTRFEDVTHEQFWNYHSAAQVTGSRAHGHEGVAELELVGRSVDWEIAGGEPLARAYTRYRLWRHGPGPWLGQVPGLSGEVRARYEVVG